MIARRLFIALAVLILTPTAVVAQTIDLNTLFPAGDASVSGRIVQLLVVMTVLSVAPGLLMMVTSFARFVIALSFLRSGLGLQTTPSNLILVSLALFITMFVMAPTFQAAWDNGVKPMVENKISQQDGYTRTTEPFRTFMKANVRDKDIAIFQDMSAQRFGEKDKAGPDDLRVLIPAFMVSELRRGFEIGFLVTLPFLGLLIASTIFCVLLMRLLSDISWTLVVLISLAICTALYVVFVFALKVPMPLGLLGP
jgi:flagellar biosynthetic protein FliP